MLKADNGQTVLSSEGYTTKANCYNGVESVRKNSATDSRYDRKVSVNSKFYFNLKATNGQVIGTSPLNERESGREAGIDSVKSMAPGAVIEDTAN